MTRAFYNPEELEIRVVGHAGAGKEGEDLVCAAVSTLTNTLEQVFLVQDEMQGHVMKIPERAMFRAWVPQSSPLLAQAFVVMETIATGLAALAEQFPEFVKFDIYYEEKAEAEEEEK